MRTYPGDVEITQDVEPYELRQMRENQVRQAERELNMQAGQNMRQMTAREIVDKIFSYHPPTDVTIPKFAAINQAAKNFAEVVLANCPPSADCSDAIRKIREARMTANAAIALNGLNL